MGTHIFVVFLVTTFIVAQMGQAQEILTDTYRMKDGRIVQIFCTGHFRPGYIPSTVEKPFRQYTAVDLLQCRVECVADPECAMITFQKYTKYCRFYKSVHAPVHQPGASLVEVSGFQRCLFKRVSPKDAKLNDEKTEELLRQINHARQQLEVLPPSPK
ncbi:uncharacterized protein LOC141900502 [Tubulanus polymorphus]|uniref:uncharacterized protein LOC141900502 n=1 Tax=Tubulanus polymorphus TaxID=672921 RepID=UPI003DA60677